jgi:uncharacterized protein (TIGR00369 family)
VKRFETPDPAWREKVQQSFDRQGIQDHLGARLTKIEPGHVEIELPFKPELAQQHGFYHAGVLATIADTAGGYAGYTLMPAGASVLAVEFKINFLAPADGERVLAIGKVVRPGRNITATEFEVVSFKDGEARPCAVGLQSLICLGEGLEGIPAG